VAIGGSAKHRVRERSPLAAMRWIAAISIAYVRGLGEFGIGTDASDTLLCAAVYLGMFENRQMNASKLGDYVGVPRSTMDLEEFERVGRVERRGTTGAKVKNKINDLYRSSN
jgi:hypothetical protein